MKDPNLTILDDANVRAVVKNECNAITQYQWAKKHKLSPQFVNDVIRGRRGISKGILKALKLKKVVRYERMITEP